MDVFEQAYKDLSKINVYKLFSEFVQDENDYITGLNKERLLKSGTDVDGKEIRTFRAEQGEVYNSFTINEKIRKGQPDDRVTLYDTGAAHSSMKAKSNQDKFSIEMDTKKPDGDIQDNVDVISALGVEDVEPIEDMFATLVVDEILLAANL